MAHASVIGHGPTIFAIFICVASGNDRSGDSADVAQLVERHLAKVEVAGPSPVIRSMAKQISAQPHGGLAERRGSGLQSRIHGFESRTHLEYQAPETERVLVFFL